MGRCDTLALDRASCSEITEGGEKAKVTNKVHVVTNSICATLSDEKAWTEMFQGH